MEGCYSECSKIPWIQFQKRKLCIQDCDAQTFQENQDEIQESQVIDQASKKTLYISVFAVIIVLIILVVLAKKYNWI